MYVYHASAHKDLKTIIPKRTMSKDKYIGDFVFATTDKKLAAMYLATRGVATLMNHTQDKPYIVICGDQEGYLQSDKGGAIYTLLSESFEPTPQRELVESELMSSIRVKPVKVELFQTSLEAMHKHGVAIYFVSKNTFDEMVATKNKDVAVSALEPFLVA